MLFEKVKARIKEIAVNTTLVLSMIVVLFGMGVNLDGFVKYTSEEKNVAQGSGNMGGSEVYVGNNSDGFHLDITAKDNSGVRKIEVYQGSDLVQESNFGGSDDTEYANIKLNNIPFGETETITVKVNGDVIDTKNIVNTRYISTAQDLAKFRNSVNTGNSYANKTIELLNDIDLSSVCGEEIGNWLPIGYWQNDIRFNGIFDGHYHIIKNMYYNGQCVGTLFELNYGTIKNVIFENAQIITNIVSNDDRPYFQGIICARNYGVIKNCGVESGKVRATNTSAPDGLNVGGLVGDVDSGTITNCYNKADVYAYDNNKMYSRVGGIAGTCYNGSISNCYNWGKVEGYSPSGMESTVSGICGTMYQISAKTGQAAITSCYNLGSVVGSGKSCTLLGIIYNGSSSTYRAGSMARIYTLPVTTYSHYYWNGSSVVKSNAGNVASNTLKTYTSTLGTDNWVDDTYSINNGYPVLRWQVESAQLNARHEYMHVGDKKQLVLDISALPFTNDSLTWHSYDENIASVDSNGLLTAVGEGYTTIWAEYSQYNIKVMAIINVAKRGAVAMAYSTIGMDMSNSAFSAILKEDGTVWTVRK